MFYALQIIPLTSRQEESGRGVELKSGLPGDCFQEEECGHACSLTRPKQIYSLFPVARLTEFCKV